jgi:threonine-phosphate decarboxylase
MSVPAHGGQLKALAARFGVEPLRLLDFSANINPDGPPVGVVSALRAALDDVAVLGEYPDLEETQLRAAIAAHADVGLDQVVVANGVIPLLEAAVRALRVTRCLLPVPSFSEYRATLERAGVVVTPHLLRSEDGYRYELDALARGGHDALLIANPQNPSGALCGRDALLELVEVAGLRGIRVLLDEAFIDYAPLHSLVTEVGRLPHLTLFRSLTKFYSVPGLRVAYAIANEAHAPAMRDQIAAWPITTLAGLGARAALADRAHAEQTLALNEARRDRLIRGMNTLGIETYAPSANFLLLRLPHRIDVSVCWRRLIVEHGIVLRDCANFEGLPGGHLRCLVRGDAENEQLLRALSSLIL